MEWKQGLPDRLRVSLESLLDSIQQYSDSYLGAEKSSVAQIWVAMAHMNQRTERLEYLVTAQRRVIKEMEGVDVDRRLERELEESLKRY